MWKPARDIGYGFGIPTEWQAKIDLSHLAGKGIFSAWNEPGRFEEVHIAEHRAIAWNDDMELCPDTLYMQLTGKSLDELPAEDVTSLADA